jgi:hypothetical protein
MKITKHQLNQIIKEELQACLIELDEELLEEGLRKKLAPWLAAASMGTAALTGGGGVAHAKAPAAQTQVDPEAARAQYAGLESMIRGHLDPEVYERMGAEIRNQLLDWLVKKYPDPSVIAPFTDPDKPNQRWSNAYHQISRYLKALNDKGSAELARQ